MPEVTGEATFNSRLSEDDIRNLANLLNYPVGSKLGLTDCRLAVRTASGIEFEDQQEVTLEFEMSNYARDWDEP